MNFEINKKAYDEIAQVIHSDVSPVGIDAKKTHILILKKLVELNEKMNNLEAKIDQIKKIMKKVILIFLLLPLISFPQKKEKINYRKKDKIDAANHITQLRKGVLLVRLSQKNNTINAMRKAGKTELADKTVHDNWLRNKEIIAAFRGYFDFCPVYFFYSEYSTSVSKNLLTNVVFLNENLEADSSIKVSNSIIYVAEFASTESDTKHYAKSEYFDEGEKKSTNYGGSELTFTALIIKDQKFKQLRKPFPYYVREFKELPIERSVKNTVIKMDQKLSQFYEVNK